MKSGRGAALGYGRKSDFTRSDKDKPGPDQYNIKGKFDMNQFLLKGPSMALVRNEVKVGNMLTTI